MTPGEEAIYDLILKENVYYAKIVVLITLTQKMFNSAEQIEEKKLIKIQEEVVKTLSKLPLARHCSRHPLCSVFNDMGHFSDYYISSQGHFNNNPFEGQGTVLTYSYIDKKIGISKEVAKVCLESLIEQEVISRKRVMGGFAYLALSKLAIIEKLQEDPGEFYPVHFDPECMSYVEDTGIYDIVKEVEEGLGITMQDVYLEEVNQL